jgi:hypothetical protein
MVPLALIAGLVGCQQKPIDPYARLIPNTLAGRKAVTAALDAWRRGEAPGRVETMRPPVVVVDKQRREGQTLEHFEILGDTIDFHARCFTVKLSLASPPDEQLARYNVFGVDPLWVFRKEDYDMISHWEHQMPEEK